MKRPQTKFHVHTMRESHVIKSKNVKINHYVKPVLLLSFFLFIDILLKLQQKILICFCKCSCNSVIIMGLLGFRT